MDKSLFAIHKLRFKFKLIKALIGNSIKNLNLITESHVIIKSNITTLNFNPIQSNIMIMKENQSNK